MYKKIIFFIFLFIFYTIRSEASIIEVDFDESMGKRCKQTYNRQLKTPEDVAVLEKMKEIYYANLPSKIESSKTPIIPKIIHQIWLGNNKIPKLYKKYQARWKKLHPDWEYKLWTDEEVKKLNIENKDLYDDAMSYPERADILRLEVLKKYGGIYADMDIDPMMKLDELVYKYDFFIGLEPTSIYIESPTLNNGFLGSTPNNPIVIGALDIIRKSWLDKEQEFNSGAMVKMNGSKHGLAVMRTMRPLTASFLENYNKVPHAIAWPATYTIPKIFNHAFYHGFIKATLRKFFDDCPMNNPVKSETIVFHNIDKSERNFEYVLFNHGYKKQNGEAKHIRKFYKGLYDSNFPNNFDAYKVPLIPNILHFVVLEDAESKEFKESYDDWLNRYPYWNVKIWKFGDLAQAGVNMELFKQIADKTEKKIFASYYILKKYGGVVVSDNIKSQIFMDELNSRYSLYSSLYPVSFKPDIALINPVLMAAEPNNYAIDKTIKSIEKNWDKNSKQYEGINLIIFRTIYPLTLNVYKYNNFSKRTIVFPTEFFNF